MSCSQRLAYAVFKMVEILQSHGKFIETETQGKAFAYLSNRALIKVFSSGDLVDFYAKPLDGFKNRVSVTPEEVESGDGWELVREDYTSSADKYNMFWRFCEFCQLTKFT